MQCCNAKSKSNLNSNTGHENDFMHERDQHLLSDRDHRGDYRDGHENNRGDYRNDAHGNHKLSRGALTELERRKRREEGGVGETDRSTVWGYAKPLIISEMILN
jgi:hypothetical protein